LKESALGIDHRQMSIFREKRGGSKSRNWCGLGEGKGEERDWSSISKGACARRGKSGGGKREIKKNWDSRTNPRKMAATHASEDRGCGAV